MNLSPRPAVASVAAVSFPSRSRRPDTGALLEIVTLRERMTHAFWLCVPFNYLALRADEIPGLLWLLLIAVTAVYASYAVRLVLAVGGQVWQAALALLVLLVPFGNLVVLLVLRTWGMGFLTSSGVQEAKAWVMRNQIRRM